ncbi:MAG: cytochrome c biogenesis protein CcsA [Candidatus Sumerlaeia bacterium]
MASAIQFLNILLPVLYACSLMIYMYCFLHPEPPVRKTARLSLWTALVVHLIYLVLVGLNYHRPPMANFFEALSFLAFTVGVVYAYLEIRVQEESAGLFILIFVFLFQLFSTAYVSHTKEVSELLATRSMAFHIGMSLFSFSALAISAVFGGMYLMLYYNIKKHQFGLIYNRLPSLERLGRLCYHGALFGFALLTLGIISGVVQFAVQTSGERSQDLKVLLVVITWAIYGVLIYLKMFRGWQGPRIAYFSILGFVTTITSLIAAFHLLH